MNRITIKHIMVFIIIIYSILFLIFPHTENLASDQGIKILQVKDFIQKNYTSFSAIYKGHAIDPDNAFFPIPWPSAFKVKNEIFYAFPFFITVVFTPVYLFTGVTGLNIMCMLFGLLTIFTCYCIARELKMSETNTKLMLIFTGVASIIPLYSYFLAEYTLSIFLVTLSILLVIKGKESDSTPLFMLAGFSAGFSAFLRIELGLYCVLLFFGVLIFKIHSGGKRQVAALFAGLSVCALALMIINYYVTGNIFGLTGFEFFQKSGDTFPLSERLFRLFEAFFFSSTKLGIFVAWPIYVFLFALFKKKYWSEKNSQIFKFFLFTILPFFFIITFFVNLKCGIILGPRFILVLQPLLTILLFLLLDHDLMKTRCKQWAIAVTVCYSIIIMTFGGILLYRVQKTSDDVNTKISEHLQHDTVILYHPELHNTVIQQINQKNVLCINPSKDWEALLRIGKKFAIHNFSIIDFANDKKAIRHPSSSAKIKVNSRFTYHGVIVENITINN